MKAMRTQLAVLKVSLPSTSWMSEFASLVCRMHYLNMEIKETPAFWSFLTLGFCSC